MPVLDADLRVPRLPVALVLDRSDDAGQETVDAFAAGVGQLVRGLLRDADARRRVDVSVVTFGDQADAVAEFGSVDDLALPALVAGGVSALGKGVVTALDLLEERVDAYRAAQLRWYRPWVVILAASTPTGALTSAAAAVQAVEVSLAADIFGVSVGTAGAAGLERLGSKRDAQVVGMESVAGFFDWLAGSFVGVAATKPGSKVLLPSVEAWAA